MEARTALITVLIVGLAIGGSAGYFGGRQVGGESTVTTTVTVVSTSVGSTTTSASGVDLQAALNNTVAPDLVVTSYSFGKGTLTAWVLNNDTKAFVITPHVPFLNGSTDSVASVISLDQKVVRVGSYLYVPPGSTIIVSVDAGTYLPGQRGVLTIYGDHWTFVYGTQKD
jgi:hypothetical protein